MKFGVIGAGVTGLATALELSKAGHDVTIIERDQTPMPKTHDEAFEWERCIACQLKSVPSAFQYQLQQQCDGLHPMLVGLVSLQATSKSREHRKCEVRATKGSPA